MTALYTDMPANFVAKLLPILIDDVNTFLSELVMLASTCVWLCLHAHRPGVCAKLKPASVARHLQCATTAWATATTTSSEAPQTSS